MHFERRKGGRHHASTNRNNPHRETARSPAALRVRTFRHVPSPSWRPSSGRPSSAGQNYATGVVAICDYTAADGGGMPIPVIVPIIAVGCAFTAPVLGMAAAGADRRRSFLHLHSSRPQPSTHAHTHRRFAPGMPQRTFHTLGKPTQAAIRAGPKCRILTASRSGSTVPLASTLSRYT